MPKRAGPKEKIDLYGEIYEIRKPTVADAMTYQEELSAENGESVKAAVNFLNRLGLPKKGAKELQADHLESLIESLLGNYDRPNVRSYQMAKMASFYGWTHEYIEGMNAKVFMMYFKAIEPLEAQKQLSMLTASDWPNLKKKARSELFKRIEKTAKAFLPKKKLTFTKESLEAIIKQHKK